MTNELKTFKQVQQGMFEHIKKEIYAQIGREWNYSGKDFDPLVHHLVSACAQQISDIYATIDESEHRVVSHLGKLLIPETNHISTPAHALASVSLGASSYELKDTIQFSATYRGKKFFFTPLLEGKLINAQLEFIVSDQGVTQTSRRQSTQRRNNYPTQIQHLLLGFSMDNLPPSFEDALFYFSMSGMQHGDLLLEAITSGQWIMAEKEVSKIKGVESETAISDFTNLDAQLLRRIAPVYDSNFVKITDPLNPKDCCGDPYQVISTWATHYQVPLEDSMQSLKQPVGKSQIVWIEINLPHAVWVEDLAKLFDCSTTTFPVVNRELKIKDDADTYFSHVLTNIVQLSSDKPIIGIRRVYDKESGITFHRSSVTAFNQTQVPTYSTRYAGVGRVDKFNAWRRYLYLISLLREESRLSDFIKKVSGEISLEELHFLLREKAETAITAKAPDDTTDFIQYIFLYPGESGAGMAVAIEFWSTQGSEGNDLPAGLKMQTSKPIPGLLKDDAGNVASLQQATLGGTDAPSETQLFEQLRDIVQRRERIVSSADVQSFLKIRLGNQLRRVETKPGVELDPRPGFGLTRNIELTLHVTDPDSPSWNLVLAELEHVVNRKSNLLIPFRFQLAR